MDEYLSIQQKASWCLNVSALIYKLTLTLLWMRLKVQNCPRQVKHRFLFLLYLKMNLKCKRRKWSFIFSNDLYWFSPFSTHWTYLELLTVLCEGANQLQFTMCVAAFYLQPETVKRGKWVGLAVWRWRKTSVSRSQHNSRCKDRMRIFQGYH